jgi:hypothetical protein
MNDYLFAAAKDQYHGLQEPRLSVEAEPQLAVWPFLVFERLDPQRQVRGLRRVLGQHPVLAGAAVDLHAA